MRLQTTVAAAAIALWCSSGIAGWTLDADASRVNFVSTKKHHVAEANTFGKLEGSIELNGNARLVVDLATVNTKIEIRDQRIREFLFEIDAYPQAVYSVHLDPGALTQALAAEAGVQTMVTLEGHLELHGVKKGLPASAIVTKTGPNTVIVNSAHPVVVRASDFELIAGLDKLQAIAKLPHISHSVPVTFHLVFRSE